MLVAGTRPVSALQSTGGCDESTELGILLVLEASRMGFRLATEAALAGLRLPLIRAYEAKQCSPCADSSSLQSHVDGKHPKSSLKDCFPDFTPSA